MRYLVINVSDCINQASPSSSSSSSLSLHETKDMAGEGGTQNIINLRPRLCNDRDKKGGNLLRKRDFALTTRGMVLAARRTARGRGRAGMGGQVSQLFSYRFTFVITRRVAARRMSKINGSHLELFPRTFAFFSSHYHSHSLQHVRFTSIRFSSLVIVTPPGFIINVSIPRPGRQS